MIDPVIVSGILGSTADIIQKLKSEKIVSHEGLVIYHEKNEVEYRIDLNLGDPKSRITNFKNFFKSKALKKISFDVLEATGIGINNENLIEMGLMTWDENKLTIDFPKIFNEVQSSLVIIIFRTTFSSSFIDKLIHRQISKVNSISNGKLISHFELVLDYANMWYSNFTSFSVRDIIFTINQSLPQDKMKSMMMGDLTLKLAKADKEALKKENARKFLSGFQQVLLELQEPVFLEKVRNLLDVEPHSAGTVLSVIPSLRVYNMQYSRIPLTVPDLFTIKISTHIEDRETAIHGTIKFDMDEYGKLLKEKFKKFRDQNKKLKF